MSLRGQASDGTMLPEVKAECEETLKCMRRITR